MVLQETYRAFTPLNTPEWKEFGRKQDEEISNMKA